MATTGRRYETIAQCVDRCQISERTVRQAIYDGVLTAYRLGPRIVRLDITEVDAAFATN